MTTAARRTFSCILLLLITMAPVPAFGQILRGTARIADSERPLDNARITAMLPDGRSVGATTTDEHGRFFLKLAAAGQSFIIAVTRIGMRPASSNAIMATERDTLDFDFNVTKEDIAIDTMRVFAAPGLNEQRLAEARRRGWRVFEPTEIQAIRERVNSFEDMLRSTGFPGLIIPASRNACIRSTRLNQCLTVVIDGVPISPGNTLINPKDVYFVALLTPNQSQLQFGDRAPYGALIVQTRTYGDRYDRDGRREQDKH